MKHFVYNDDYRISRMEEELRKLNIAVKLESDRKKKSSSAEESSRLRRRMGVQS